MPSRDPFEPFDRTVRRLFEGMNTGGFEARVGFDMSQMEQYVDQKEENLVVTVDLPGVEKDAIDIRVRENHTMQFLSINIQQSDDYNHQSTTQRIALKEEVDGSEATATYNNGVLTITLPLRDRNEGSTSIEVL